MIARDKKTKIIIQEAKANPGGYLTGKEITRLLDTAENVLIAKGNYELFFDEYEVQQRIEAAVEEHEQSHMDVLQGWHDECEKLKARITELEAERQPVEVSAELAEAIEWIKRNQSKINKVVTINMTSQWELIFIAADPFHREEMYAAPPQVLKALGKTSSSERVEIIKRGYTAPDPLRTRIAAILGNDHEQLDAVVAAAREDEVE